MGHDVIAICQHKLNTASVHTTALDLSEVFDVSVRYGYMDDWIDPETGKESSFEFVELGRVERKGKPLYTLRDSLYMDRLHQPEIYTGETEYDFYGENYDATNFYIYPDCFSALASFDMRWWNFVRYFKGSFFDRPEWQQYIMDYRIAVWNELKRLGGKIALYGDDQGPSAYIAEDVASRPFETVKQKLLTDFGEAVLNVSTFQRLYPKGQFAQINWLAYIDDFADLE